MNAPWLFAEAYKYRRLHECFSVSKFFHDYDVFYRQKVRFLFHITVICAYIINWAHSATLSRVLRMLSSSYLCASLILSKFPMIFPQKKNSKLSV